MATIDKPAPWYHAAPVHAILVVGAVFFVLPLVWMIATSLKPLEQTLRVPSSVGEALLGRGHRATIDCHEYDVTLERPIAPSDDEPFWIVRPAAGFPAGEMTHPFGPEVWSRYPIFNEQELARMNARVEPGMKVCLEVLFKKRINFRGKIAAVISLTKEMDVSSEVVDQFIVKEPNIERKGGWLLAKKTSAPLPVDSSSIRFQIRGNFVGEVAIRDISLQRK